MSDGHIVLQGNIAGDLITRNTGKGQVCSFRLASSRTYRDAEGNWQTAESSTIFIDVQCWGRLAENVQHSLVKGNPVIVSGRLMPNNYTNKENVDQYSFRVRATSVGVDLRRVKVGEIIRDRGTVQHNPEIPSVSDFDNAEMPAGLLPEGEVEKSPFNVISA